MSVSSAAPSDATKTGLEPGSAASFTNTANRGAQIGQNLGTIVNNFGGQSGVPLTPSLSLPFPRDLQFINRQPLLEQIHDRCFVQTSWTALVGLGGVGKSQLAIEYAYRIVDQSPDTWGFWVHASNIARFEQSFRDLAEIVKIPERNDPQANIFQLVQSWLRDARNGRWILILDNLDDASFLTKAWGDKEQSHAFLRYIPHTSHGSVLVTTRNRSVAAELVDKSNTVAVGPMDEKQAVALLKSKLGESNVHEESQVLALATTLEFMPLAMVQAAAYISNLRYSIQQYLNRFSKSDRKKEELLSYNQDLGLLRRDLEAQNMIAITWQISFDHISETRQSAADLLSLMSFFDRQGIPATLLQRPRQPARSLSNEYTTDSSENGDDENTTDSSEDESEDDPEFRQDIRTLENYSFISVNESVTVFEMHSLVQFATRKWLQDHEKAELWKQRFIESLYTVVPTGQFENWVRFQVLFPHIKSVMLQKPKQDDRQSLEKWATIVYRAAWYCWLKGNANDAEEMSIKATRAKEMVLGPDHQDTLCCMDMVGRAFGIGGKFRKAEEMHKKVMETRKVKLGADHPNTLISMESLALAYLDQGRWDEAEELQGQIIEMKKAKLGADHLETLASMDNLASTYRDQGRWEAAEELQVQVVEMEKVNLGVDHPDTLTSMSNLALTYLSQGRWEEAEELGVQTLEMRKAKLGVDHPDTLTSMNNLASTYRDQGRWEEAEELDVQTLEMRKAKLGVDHPNTLASMSSLAFIYSNQGRWEAAEELGVQVVEMSKTKLGADHPDTLTNMHNLAWAWKDGGKSAEAVQLMEECVELRVRVLGADHPRTRTSSETLAEWKAETATTEGESGQQ